MILYHRTTFECALRINRDGFSSSLLSDSLGYNWFASSQELAAHLAVGECFVILTLPAREAARYRDVDLDGVPNPGVYKVPCDVSNRARPFRFEPPLPTLP